MKRSNDIDLFKLIIEKGLKKYGKWFLKTCRNPDQGLLTFDPDLVKLFLWISPSSSINQHSILIKHFFSNPQSCSVLSLLCMLSPQSLKVLSYLHLFCNLACIAWKINGLVSKKCSGPWAKDSNYCLQTIMERPIQLRPIRSPFIANNLLHALSRCCLLRDRTIQCV